MISRRTARASAAATVVLGIGSIAAAVALTTGARAAPLTLTAEPSRPSPAVTDPPVAAGGGVHRADPISTMAPVTTAADVAGAPLGTAPPAPPSTMQPVSLRPPTAVSVGGESASIIPVGVLPDGELQLPDDPTLVGWWATSGMVGAPTGSIVLAGHVDSRRYGLGTFAALHTLRPGDLVQLFADDGVAHPYVVSSIEQTPKAALPPDLLTASGPPHLVLITCGGAFDSTTRHYADNLIVIATAI